MELEMDYLSYFKLKEAPYEISPNPRYLYLSPQHADAIGMCKLTVQERRGLMVVYGQIGMGKSTIVRHLYDVINGKPHTQVGMLNNPALKTENAFLQAIMEQFDVAPKRSYAKSLAAFEEFLFDSHNKGNNSVIIIDEAQKLTPKMLGVIHSLLNFETNTEKFLQIILVGQNELAENIDAIREIKSRVARFGSLQELGPDETKEMIAFRWHTASAGKSQNPFTDQALETIYKFSGGIPREANKLCHETLLTAFQEESTEVTPEMVVDAAAVMRLTREDR